MSRSAGTQFDPGAVAALNAALKLDGDDIAALTEAIPTPA
jgi:hypothetical protein